MIEFNWTYVLILIMLLVSIDKGLTVLNIKAVEKNFPEIDRYSIEKNPLAKNFFIQFGLGWGTALYWLFSILTFLGALFLFKWCLTLFHVTNALSIALWIMVILYCVIIGNNLFMLLKFSKIVP